MTATYSDISVSNGSATRTVKVILAIHKVGWFSNEVARLFKVSRKDFYLTAPHGDVMEKGQMSLSSFVLTDGSVVTLHMRGKGGVSKVIKTHLKTKVTETTTANDKNIYEQGFIKAVELHTTKRIDVAERFKSLSIDKLKVLLDYLKKDKSASQKKAEKLHEYLDEFGVLQSLQHKLNSALHRLKDLTMDAIEDEDGKFDNKGFAERISVIIALKEEAEMRM